LLAKPFCFFSQSGPPKLKSSYRQIKALSNGSLLPAIVGLVLGVAFIASFAFFINAPSQRFPDGPPVEEEFKNIDQILEVKSFLEKYGYNSTKGLARSSDSIMFYYDAKGKYLDKDGDGISEANRHLEISVLYDESGGNLVYKNFDPSRIKQIESRCLEVSYGGNTIDIIRPAYGNNVKAFIQNANC
jgi:hypothetical protein